MRYKQQTEVLHETKQTIRGDEPFLRYPRPHMIISLNGFGAGSHNFFEGYFEAMARIKKGDTLAFQWVRVTRVEMTRWERVKEWLKERFKI